MLLNYLKICWHNFLSNKFYSSINIAGLAIGLACTQMIALYVGHEMSYDNHQPHAERTWRFSKLYLGSGAPVAFAGNDAQVGPLLADSLAEVEDYLRIFRASMPVRLDDTVNFERDIHFADSSLASFFTLDWQRGDPQSALADPNSIVLTESLARKYFNNIDPLGQSLVVDEEITVKVTGVIADLPDDTHLGGNAFVSMSTRGQLLENDMQGWNGFNYHTYLRLAEGSDYTRLEPLLKETLIKHVPQELRQYFDYAGLNIRDIHLHSVSPTFELKEAGSLNEILILTAAAVTLLGIACINFINLTTARLHQRYRELSVRQVVGASYWQQLQQLLLESGLMALIALLLSWPLMELAMPLISEFAGLSATFFQMPGRTLLLASTVVLPAIALLLAVANSLFLKSMTAQSSRTNELYPGLGKRGLARNILVMSQFSATIILLVSISVIFLQVQYSKRIDLGFNRDNIIIIEPLNGIDTDISWATFKGRLLEHSSISHVTASAIRPFQEFTSTSRVRLQGEQQETVMTRTVVDPDFFETYDVEVISGRSFSANRISDQVVFPDQESPHTSASFIINESALGLFDTDAEGVLGKTIEIGYDSDFGISAKGSVIGVVADMHLEAIQNAIEPMFFLLSQPEPLLASASIRVWGDNKDVAFEYVESVVDDMFPGEFIKTFSLEQSFQELYLEEQNFAHLLTFFTLLVGGISCLGLLGLSAYLIDRRTKEIGIRKVMGSSVWSIILLLTRDFSKLILAANIIAWPIAYLLMHRWLENFAYRIDLSPMIFIGCGLTTLSMAWLTVSGKAGKAAMAKPVLALKYE